MPSSTGISPLEIARILWRRRWILLVVMTLGMGGAVAATAMLPRVYAARAAVLIEPRLEPSPDGSGGVVPILPDSATVDSLAQVLGSRSMAREVITLFPYTTLFRSESEERRVGKECKP